MPPIGRARRGGEEGEREKVKFGGCGGRKRTVDGLAGQQRWTYGILTTTPSPSFIPLLLCCVSSANEGYIVELSLAMQRAGSYNKGSILISTHYVQNKKKEKTNLQGKERRNEKKMINNIYYTGRRQGMQRHWQGGCWPCLHPPPPLMSVSWVWTNTLRYSFVFFTYF